PVRAFVGSPFSVNPGGKYTLEVISPSRGRVEANVAVPSLGSILPEAPAVIQNPAAFQEPVVFRLTLGPEARGLLFRMFVDYEVFAGGAWEPRRVEVPESIVEITDCRSFVGSYPLLGRRTTLHSTFVGVGSVEVRGFSRSAYLRTLLAVRARNNFQNVRMTRIRVELVQVEPALYSYYNIVNGFRDDVSMRSDDPDYTNIRGGLGVFGAMTRQEVVYAISDTLGVSLTCE
ncbi:MAG: hypothetical protein WD295_05925, partial [Bacteroidota bacterium]